MIRSGVRAITALMGVALWTLVATSPLTGQGVRGWTSSNVGWVQLRPVAQDTAPRDQIVVGSDGALTFQGQPVYCGQTGPCTYYRARDVEHAATGTQDLGFTAWGLGMEGLSFTGLLRGRARFGGDFVWPRSEDEVDVLLGYAQLVRGPAQVRLGRQETLSGLGFAGYDGASVNVRVADEIALEAYGGRSLARGLNEPRNEALRGLEDFIPDESAWLIGGFVSARFRDATAVGVRYQREIWADRSGLISERASVDARTALLRPLHLDASADWDMGFGRLGKAHLTLRYLTPDVPWTVEVTGRRYLPYFEMSTVWGFFSPVPYHEVMGRIGWTGDPVTAWAAGGWRTYDETHTVTIFDPLEGDGWRAEAGAVWRAAERLAFEGRYELEWGVGAFLNAGDATVRFRPADGVDLAATLTSFQRFEEFRVGEGRALGGGLQLGLDLGERVRLDGGLSVLRHDPDGRQVNEAWNQTRGWTSLRFEFGEDPGRPRRRFRR